MGAAFGFQSIAKSFAVGEIDETVKGGNRLRHGSATIEREAIDIWTARADGFEADLIFALLQRGVGDQIFPARPVACVIEWERFLNKTQKRTRSLIQIFAKAVTFLQKAHYCEGMGFLLE